MNPVLVVLAAVLSAIALYLPTRTDAHTRVAIDGRSIRMLIAGTGDATVVFEAGDGGILEHWGKVQPAVSRFARTVSYDRAGLGLSDIGPAPRDGRRIATELRRALLTAGIAPPYIMAGMSLGGPYVRIFTGMYPEDVAGMVLVDPATTDKERLAHGARVPAIPVFLIDAVSPREIPFATETIRAQRRKNRPEIEADSIEYQRWLEGIPGGRLIVTNRSGHNVAIERPELVVETIREMVDAVKRPRSISGR